MRYSGYSGSQPGSCGARPRSASRLAQERSAAFIDLPLVEDGIEIGKRMMAEMIATYPSQAGPTASASTLSTKPGAISSQAVRRDRRSRWPDDGSLNGRGLPQRGRHALRAVVRAQRPARSAPRGVTASRARGEFRTGVITPPGPVAGQPASAGQLPPALARLDEAPSARSRPSEPPHRAKTAGRGPRGARPTCADDGRRPPRPAGGRPAPPDPVTGCGKLFVLHAAEPI